MNIDTSLHSVNYSPRNGASISMLVIHSTEGTRKSDIPILLGQTPRKVSVHYYVQRDGVIYQFLPDTVSAWHAGASNWLGHGSIWIQEHSLGIEMESLNTGSVYKQRQPDIQYNAVVELSRMLVRKYAIQQAYFVRHKDIAPSRKSDPSFFPWLEFRDDVYR